MTGDQPGSNESEQKDQAANVLFNRILVAIVAGCSYLTIQLINASYSKLALACNLSLDNIECFNHKMHSSRIQLIIIGSTVNHFVAVYFYEYLKYFSLTSITLSIICILFVSILIHLSTKLLTYIHIALNIQAFLFGMFQISFFALVPQFVSITHLSTNISLSIVSVFTGIIDLFISNRNLLLARIYLCICLLSSIIGCSLWYHYIVNIYSIPVKFDDEIIKEIKKLKSFDSDKSKNPKDEITKLYSKLDKVSDDSKSVDTIHQNIGVMSTITKISSSEYKVNYTDQNKQYYKTVKEESEKIKNGKLDMDECQNKIDKFQISVKDIVSKAKEVKKTINKFYLYKEHNSKTDDLIKKINKFKTNLEDMNSELNELKLTDMNKKIKSENKIVSKFTNIIDSFISKNSTSQLNDEQTKDNNKEVDQIYADISLIKDNTKKSLSEINNICQTFKTKIKETEEKLGVFEKNVEIDYNDFLDEIKAMGYQKMSCVISPFVMIIVCSFFNDFLYPLIIPEGIMDFERCNIINKIFPLSYLLGYISIFMIDKQPSSFTKNLILSNTFWLLIIPQLIVLIISIMSIHSNLPCLKTVINSKIIVSILIFILLCSYSLMEAASYLYIANYVYYLSGDVEENIGVLTSHNIVALFFHYFYSKVSIGYNHTRVKLGYTLPDFKPSYGNDSHSFCYWIFQTLKYAILSAIGDLRFNIKDYA